MLLVFLKHLIKIAIIKIELKYNKILGRPFGRPNYKIIEFNLKRVI